MGNIEKLNRIHETIAWGAIFLWWGITELFKFPNGMDALGIGLILLGLMAVRSLNSLPVNGLTITLGILSLAWGVLDLMSSALHVPFKVPVFAVLLIVLGLTLLALVLLKVRKTGFGGLR
jgi:hypothetical protein